jgi:hypothetical protein
MTTQLHCDRTSSTADIKNMSGANPHNSFGYELLEPHGALALIRPPTFHPQYIPIHYAANHFAAIVTTPIHSLSPMFAKLLSHNTYPASNQVPLSISSLLSRTCFV